MSNLLHHPKHPDQTVLLWLGDGYGDDEDMCLTISSYEINEGRYSLQAHGCYGAQWTEGTAMRHHLIELRNTIDQWLTETKK